MQSNTPLPVAIEAEQALLGAMMIEKAAMLRGLQLVNGSDFYRPQHRVIFQAIQHLFEGDQVADLVTVQTELDRMGALTEVGGVAYLMACHDQVITTRHLEAYAKQVIDKATIRRFEAVGREIIGRAREDGLSGEELKSLATQLVLDAHKDTHGTQWMTGEELMGVTWEEIQKRHEGGFNPVIQTGVRRLDYLINDFKPFTIIAARPSLGKSAFALQTIVESVPTLTGPIAVFSIEMDELSIGFRLLAADSGVSMDDIAKGRYRDDILARMAESGGRLTSLPILLDTSTRRLTEIVAKTKLAVLEHKICAIVIDYVQMIEAPGKDLYMQSACISATLAKLAKENKIKVIGLAQFNREPERRRGSKNKNNSRPRISDILGGGRWEQDLDLGILLHDPSRDDEDDDLPRPSIRKLELIVDKHRNGKTGIVNCMWDGAHQRFTDVAIHSLDDAPPDRKHWTEDD
jgi:replicative DNA helicase